MTNLQLVSPLPIDDLLVLQPIGDTAFDIDTYGAVCERWEMKSYAAYAQEPGRFFPWITEKR